jgi:hypothetical protein
MANHVLLSKFVEMTTEQSNPFEDTKSQSETQNQQENNLSLQVPPPTRMVIPPCSVCQAIPGAFPVYTCETCFGKTIVCQSCASTLQYNPSNIHKNHRFRVWLDGLWYDSRHIFFKTLPPSEPFGPPWAFQELDSIALGHNLLTENVKVLSFFQRPAGDLRLGLANVPPGTWSVTLQISTWPSPSFDENALKLLRFTKKLSVQAGTTSVGGVQAYIGPVDSLEDYIDHERVVPTVAFAGNTVLHSVVHGTLKALKVRFPNPVVIGSNGAVGLYVNYFRNSSSFTKEKWEVQQNLGFCWRLEGLKFEKRQDLT